MVKLIPYSIGIAKLKFEQNNQINYFNASIWLFFSLIIFIIINYLLKKVFSLILTGSINSRITYGFIYSKLFEIGFIFLITITVFGIIYSIDRLKSPRIK